MKFFRKTSVAVLFTLLVIALCCVIGYTGPPPTPPGHLRCPRPAGRRERIKLLPQLDHDDDAGLFSMDTTDTLAEQPVPPHSNYGCLMAIQTINYLLVGH